MTWAQRSILVGAVLALFGCGDADDNRDNFDDDGDGFTPAEGDCDDQNGRAYPEAVEPCDGVDNNCDDVIDDGYDSDGDHYTTCEGDCRDNDVMAYPGAREVADGLDNDCDRLVDNHLPTFDDDGDGYSEEQGDCNDDPDSDGDLVGPGAIEVATLPDGSAEMIDNDCDGEFDEPIAPCPEPNANPDEPYNYVLALDVCHEVLSATWSGVGNDGRARAVMPSFGDVYVPHVGPTLVQLSTGVIAGTNRSTSLATANTRPHPDPGPALMCEGSTYTDPATVNDYHELQLLLDVPTNAKSFSFDFNFMSIEFPEFVCSTFDDTFVAFLESEAYTGNVSFDDNGNRVSINIGFFDECATGQATGCVGDEELLGTGYQGTAGGGTGWLTTTSPVVPGEKIRLTFMIWDEGDHILDSAVLLDNFRWGLEPVDGPSTVE